jgi:hypothetical protein
LPRRSLTVPALLLLPALALVVWLVSAQLPLWTAPEPHWFAPGTPGVCAAVESLKLYEGQRSAASERGAQDARSIVGQLAANTYEGGALALSEPLIVQATLPGDERRTYSLVTAQLSGDAAAVVYVDAESGEARAVITTVENASVRCDFDLRGALITAVRSLPMMLLAAYAVLTVVGLIVWWLWHRKGTS